MYGKILTAFMVLAWTLNLAANPVFAKAKLTVGTEKSFPPFVFEENGKLAGFEVDLVREIAEELQMGTVFVDIAFDALIPALTAGRIDMIAAGMDITPERLEQIAFSDVYYLSPDAVVVQKTAEGLSEIADLRGMTVAVQFGTVQDQCISRQKQISVLRYQRTDDVLRALLRKEAEVALVEETVAREYLKKEEAFGENLRIAFTLEETAGMAFGFRKDSVPLRESVNGVLSLMEQDGRMEELRQKWFGAVNQ
ncbi:MAG: transporter substrate-binding domain-containing protein [Thermovirgaceae bacterium]